MKRILAYSLIAAACVLCGCSSRWNPFAEVTYYLGIQGLSGNERCNDRVVAIAALKGIDARGAKYGIKIDVNAPPHPNLKIVRSEWKIGGGPRDDTMIVAIDDGTGYNHSGVSIYPGHGHSLSKKTDAFLADLIRQLHANLGRNDLTIGVDVRVDSI